MYLSFLCCSLDAGCNIYGLLTHLNTKRVFEIKKTRHLPTTNYTGNHIEKRTSGVTVWFQGSLNVGLMSTVNKTSITHSDVEDKKNLIFGGMIF